jgi:NADH:ubiquinone oxidoreductase subunit 2 (subunit N)
MNGILSLKEINIFSEIFLTILIIYLLLLGVLLKQHQMHSANVSYSLYSCVLILIFSCILNLNIDAPYLSLVGFNNSILTDYLSIVSKVIVGISVIVYLLVIQDYLKKQRNGSLEYLILILLSVLGIYLLCSSNDLITAYLSIELQSLAFYVMSSFNNHSSHSVESGLKYFIIGSLSSALFLFGSSLIYGLSGSYNFNDFKDIFFWTYSGNSALLSSRSITNSLASFEVTNDINEEDQITNLKAILGKLKILKRYAYLSDNDVSKIMIDCFDFFNTKNNSQKSEIYEEILQELNKYIYYKDPYYRTCIIEERFNRVNANIEYRTKSLELFFVHIRLKSIAYLSYFVFDNPSAFNFDTTFGISASYTKKYMGAAWTDPFIISDFKHLSLLFKTSETDNLKFIDKTIRKTMESFEQTKIAAILASIAHNVPLFYEPNDLQTYQYMLFNDNLIELGLLLILFSIFIKLALAPFHLWSVDVYEGSPLISTFFFAVIAKLSFFVILIRICYSSFYSFIHVWQFYGTVFAVTSIMVGSVTGLVQRKLKSLLAYSSISHMGYIMLPFSSGTFEGIQMVFCYLIIYILSGLCLWSSFLSIRLVQADSVNKHNKDLGELSLLRKSNPTVSFILLVCLFSMAGIPPMAGFLAKIGVFLTILGTSLYFIAFLSVLLSIISTFYYIRIVQILYFEKLLVGKLYYPIISQNYAIIHCLFFILILLFLNPTNLYAFTYKISFLFY